MSAHTITLYTEYFKGTVTYREVKNYYRSWEFIDIYSKGNLVGFAYKKDGEAHIHIDKPFRKQWATKSLLKSLKEWAGMTKTVTSPDNTEGHRLASFFGLHLDKELDGVCHYVL